MSDASPTAKYCVIYLPKIIEVYVKLIQTAWQRGKQIQKKA